MQTPDAVSSQTSPFPHDSARVHRYGSGMRVLYLVVSVVAVASSASAQSPGQPSPTDPPVRDGIVIGVTVTPALDGFSDLWLMPAGRLSVPLGTRAGLDLEAGRIIGATLEYPASSELSKTQVHHFYAAQLRWLTRPRASDGTTQYLDSGDQLCRHHAIRSAGRRQQPRADQRRRLRLRRGSTVRQQDPAGG